MTDASHRALQACLLLAAALGVGLAAPRAHELGLDEPVDCDAFAASPRETEAVRLTGCEVHPPPPSAYASGPWTGRPGPERLWLDVPVSPGRSDLFVAVSTVRRYDSAPYTGLDWVAHPVSPLFGARRILGLLFAAAGLLLALALRRLQRRWRRRERTLRGAPAPLVF